MTRGARMRAWLVDRMPTVLQGRLTLGGRELGLVALVAAAALCVVAGIALKASASAASPATKSPLVGASVPARATRTPPLVAARGSTPPRVVVDVAGAVVHPRVVTLPAGARVFDALKAAGGVRRGIDVSALNLARVLVDGEQIVVGRSTGAAPATSSSAPSSAGQSKPTLVSLNRATEADLEGLPGIGPVTAKSILAWRQQHGAFAKVDELQEVDGIGPKTFAKLKLLVAL